MPEMVSDLSYDFKKKLE